jgi:glycosyltransferase involved in cell wall biosynthesis
LNKTLLILTPGFPKDENDSTCLPTQQLFVLTVKKLFPEVEIIVVTLQYPQQSTYQWNDVTVHPLNGKKYPAVFRWLFWLHAYLKLLRLSKGKKLMGVLSFWCNETALIGSLFSRRQSVAHKIWISGQDARKTNRFVKWINPSPGDLVAMSPFLRNEFAKNHHIRPSHIIRNAAQRSHGSLKKDIDIIGAGSLIPLKQFEIFVEVISQVVKTNPDLKVALFGKGPEENRLKNLIEQLGLSDTIKLYGEVNHETLLKCLGRSKILLHPSSYEGYSTVCLEALANGCHVVSLTQAEEENIRHWRVVKDKTEMLQAALRILREETDFTPVQVTDMQTTVKAMLALYS